MKIKFSLFLVYFDRNSVDFDRFINSIYIIVEKTPNLVKITFKQHFSSLILLSMLVIKLGSVKTLSIDAIFYIHID